MFISGVILGLIALAFLLIVIEDIIHIDKAKTTLFFGSLSWVLYFIFPPAGIEHHVQMERLNENILDIATLWMFLMAAMTFVAYLGNKGVIDGVVSRILPQQMSERRLMLYTGAFAFVLSSLADNITSTLICMSILLSLNLERRKLLRYVVLVIFSVNAGGSALITGDVTTLMIFLANKVEIMDLFLLWVPSAISVCVLALLLARPLTGDVALAPREGKLGGTDLFIGLLFVGTILSTLAFNILFEIPPLLTFLFGLSLMFLLVQFLNKDEEILDYVRRIEFDTLLFFLGVLLLVGMLKELGVLDYFPHLYEYLPVLWANYVVGILSALFDNVPLTAALLKSGVEMSKAEWLTLTYAVGVGGSLLIIGSAAGVVAMSKVAALTFASYLRYFFALLVAYSCGFAAVYAVSHYLL